MVEANWSLEAVSTYPAAPRTAEPAEPVANAAGSAKTVQPIPEAEKLSKLGLGLVLQRIGAPSSISPPI